MKPISKIKHGDKIISALEPGKLYFVPEIQRLCGLDPKSFLAALNQLRNNKHIVTNSRGQWFIELK